MLLALGIRRQDEEEEQEKSLPALDDGKITDTTPSGSERSYDPEDDNKAASKDEELEKDEDDTLHDNAIDWHAELETQEEDAPKRRRGKQPLGECSSQAAKRAKAIMERTSRPTRGYAIAERHHHNKAPTYRRQ
eukprot:jgi/Chlat1/8308/Chrsp78S09213